MLVLTRKSQEQIRIGNDITVTILRVKGNSVRIGIEAPREVRVIRGELPPKETQLAQPTIEVRLPGVESLELADEPAAAESPSDAAPAELSGARIPTARRSFKDYVASTISHAV